MLAAAGSAAGPHQHGGLDSGVTPLEHGASPKAAQRVAKPQAPLVTYAASAAASTTASPQQPARAQPAAAASTPPRATTAARAGNFGGATAVPQPVAGASVGTGAGAPGAASHLQQQQQQQAAAAAAVYEQQAQQTQAAQAQAAQAQAAQAQAAQAQAQARTQSQSSVVETGPITPAQALKRYSEYLTAYEQSEILQYQQVGCVEYGWQLSPGLTVPAGARRMALQTPPGGAQAASAATHCWQRASNDPPRLAPLSLRR
jgi:hypothetical protein